MNKNSNRVSKEQKAYIVQYMEENIKFAHERSVGNADAKSLQDQWDTLATSLNALGGAIKESEGWKKIQNKDKGLRVEGCIGVNGNVALKELTELTQYTNAQIQKTFDISHSKKATSAADKITKNLAKSLTKQNRILS